jgi:PAS domain S-box-containing protein
VTAKIASASSPISYGLKRVAPKTRLSGTGKPLKLSSTPSPANANASKANRPATRRVAHMPRQFFLPPARLRRLFNATPSHLERATELCYGPAPHASTRRRRAYNYGECRRYYQRLADVPASGMVLASYGASLKGHSLKRGTHPPDYVRERKAPGRRPARNRDVRAAQHYQAIIESSDDAILSKDLDGVILSWNNGAERLFGFTAEEAMGKPVTIVIPLDRRDEEPAILDKIHRGERIHHFETVRQRKDGSLLDISLTISPIRNSRGKIIGASKIARDITELKRAQERQHLLLREMSHRVKNLFALSGSIVSLSARSATSVDRLAASARERLSALARAHSLTFLHGADSDALPDDAAVACPHHRGSL